MKPILRTCLLIAVVLGTACSRAPQMAYLEDGTALPIGRKLWPAPKDVAPHMQLAGLPDVKGQDVIYHMHVHLQVFKDGQQILVPGDIGVGKDVLSPVHTHEDRGVIHVESPEVKLYTLGQFFQLWNVPLDGARLIKDGTDMADPVGYKFQDGDLLTVYWGNRPQ